mmetsp:Transcript_8474/g.9866  ORF Transcript_8474/g.9866 Transcript_8474/m.9866 type:complete len:150 (+) Transcript_8474:83-532(+)
MANSTDGISGASFPGGGNNRTAITHNGARSGESSAATASATVTASATMTMTTDESNAESNNEEVLRLTLRSRPNVTWDENVVDNEGLGRKSSKRCCIFHKQRAFGESSTDSSDYDSGDNDSNKKPMARKKKGGIGTDKKKTPDHLRFHA